MASSQRMHVKGLITSMSNTQATGLQLVVFSLGEDLYGIETLHTRVINLMETVTPVPRTPDYLTGIINLRGQIIPVLCLRSLLGLEPRVETSETRVIIVELPGLHAGLIVDEVQEVVTKHGAQVSPPPPGFKGQYVSGICQMEGNFVSILDLHKLFAEQLQKAI